MGWKFKGLFLFVLLLMTTTVFAQEERFLSYALQDIPDSLTLKRGTVVEFRGTMLEWEQPQPFLLRCGENLRAVGTFEQRWALRWDTSREKYNSCCLSLWRVKPSGGLTLLHRFRVNLTPDAPFTIVPPAENGVVYGKASLKVRAAEGLTAQNVHWTLDGTPLDTAEEPSQGKVWNTRQAQPGVYRLAGSVVLDDGSLYPLEPVPVRLVGPVGVVPFPFGETLDPAALNGNITVRTRIAPGITPRQVVFRLNGKEMGIRTAAPFDTLPWNPANLKKGLYRLTAEVTDVNGKQWPSPPYEFVALPAPVSRKGNAGAFVSESLAGSREERSVTESGAWLAFSVHSLPRQLSVVAGTKIALTGSFINEGGADVALVVDAMKMESFRKQGAFQLVLDTRLYTPGVRRVAVRVDVADGTSRPVAKSEVTIYKKSPVHIVAPSKVEDVLRPVTLSIRAEAGFKIRSVSFYREGRYLRSDPENLNTAFWDTRSEPSGRYRVWALVKSTDGSVFRTPDAVVTVPVRISGEAPVQVTIARLSEEVTVRAGLLKELRPASVDYLVDGHVVGTRTEAPFDVAKVEGTELTTGTHRLTVRVTDASGARYASDPVTFKAVNHPLEEQLALLKRTTPPQPQTPSPEPEVPSVPAGEERPIVRNLQGDIRRRAADRQVGKVGRVYGLAVLEAGGIGKDGRHVPLLRTGMPVMVTAELRPGSGRSNLDTLTDADARIAAERAVAYVKEKTTALGAEIDWNSVDVILHYGEEGMEMGGGSAGAATAIALLSTALQLPVDPTVAITGAIGEEGQVEAVGGVDLKAASAFLDPHIRTLVVPAGSQSEADLARLRLRRPELFARHQILFARNLDEIVRVVLMGYQEKYAARSTTDLPEADP